MIEDIKIQNANRENMQICVRTNKSILKQIIHTYIYLRLSGVFAVNFKHISHLFLVFLLDYMKILPKESTSD